MNSLSAFVRLAMLAVTMAAFAGCASCQTCPEPLANYSFRHSGPCYFGPLMCFGYHSTCWRAWPEECAPCPPYTLTPELLETAPPPEPQLQPQPAIEPAPPLPGPDLPLPTPAVPSPSDRGYYSNPGGEQNFRPAYTEAGYAAQPVRLAPPESH